MISFKFVYILLFVCAPVPFSFAQMDMPVGSAADRFSSELFNLKTSADTLYKGNAVLALRNNQLRMSLGQLQDRLQKLSDINDALTKEILKLQNINAARSSKIAGIEKETFELDVKMEHVSTAMKLDQDVLMRLQTEDEALTRQIVSLGGVVAKTSDNADAFLLASRSKEKLRILKMIDSSKQRQEIIIQQIASSHKHTPVSVVTVEKTGDKRDLVAKIKHTEDEIEQLRKVSTDFTLTGQWNEKELRQLDEQVRNLQKNHDELEDLVSRMEEKTQKRALTKDQIQEQNRYRASFNDVNQESQLLKQNLIDLRQQMVELDKRKTYLDALSRN